MTEPPRPDPDELLGQVEQDAARARRGKLKIFFGASAGVGKTYSMLESARAAKAAGTDIVIGYVEPHGRTETDRLLAGLEQIPRLAMRYRGLARQEFDLDAALTRAPCVVVVDELAHSNLTDGEPKPRHAKRWQDVEEILDAGINVWTTLNVQHLESLNDVVAGITGVRQQETVPDSIFDEADEVELIDLSPDDLIARLEAGKVYLAEHVANAREKFFRHGNLLALREMALRRTADRVDAAARAYRGTGRTSQPWLARDRFMIAVGPDDQAEQLVRVGKRFADALDAEWLVVSVETPNLLKLGERARNRRIDVLRLAESLGAQTVTIDGPSASVALLEYARLRNITRIVVGEPKRIGWRALFRPSTATKLVRAGTNIDISVIARRAEPDRIVERPDRGGRGEIRWDRYAAALGISLLSTLVAAVMFPYFELTNIVMIYLLGATIAALRLGRGAASFTALTNVLAFDFCFVPPRFTFGVASFQYVVTFAVMLAVALIIAKLVADVRAQTRVAGARERRTSLLYAMSRELAATRGRQNIADVAVKHVAETFASRAAVLAPGPSGELSAARGDLSSGLLDDADLSIARWVFDHGKPAGLGTDTLPAARAQYLPINGSKQTLGVLAVEPSQKRRLLLPEQRHLLETFAGQIGLALERAELADKAESSRVSAETEGLRNTLLASISHDLRTPLAVIAGASSALNDISLQFDAATRARLTRSIESKAHEMSDIISNVLDLMRFESGHVNLRRDWQNIDDLIGSARARVDDVLAGHPVKIDIPPDLPAVNVDAPLVAQVFTNLFVNAAKYTPAGTQLWISARQDEDRVRIDFEDNGPGLPAGDSERLFAKFQRGRDEGNTGGAGLGLAICRAVIQAHGGSIKASQRSGGGARFEIVLPIDDPTP